MKKYFLFILAGCILSACSNSGSNSNTSESNNLSKDRIEITNDMENAKGNIPSWIGAERVFAMTDPPAHSGTYACITNDSAEFTYHYEELLKNINNGIPKRVIFSGWVYTTVANPKFSAICALTENHKNYAWRTFPLGKQLMEAGKWVEFSSDFYIDDKPLSPDMLISVYAWNQSKKPIYVDDLKVTFVY